MKTSFMVQSKPKADSAPSGSAFLNLQRRLAFGRSVAGRESKDCFEHRELSVVKGAFLQRSAVNQKPVTAIPPIVAEVLRSPGLPLDSASRSFFEPRFGHDFSEVHVHTGAKAAESAGAVNALAYTVGRDIVFGSGQYLPGTGASRQLLGHELTHVVQQRGGVASALSINTPGDEFEQEANRTALSLDEESRAPSIHPAGTGLMRQAEEHHASEEKTGAEKPDANVKELQEKVGKLVAKNFQGDFKKGFDHYDANHDGAVDAGEIKNLLKDADVGNRFTRGSWVDGILSKMDTNKDGKIDWKEFQAGIKG